MNVLSEARALSGVEPRYAPLAGGNGTAEQEERQRFRELQQRLAPIYQQAFPDPHAPQTIVVVPGLTLDAAELGKLTGAPHYEERLLCLLMLLRRPRTHVVYVTSQPISPTVIDYYLNLLPGVPISHAKRRLTLLSCYDGSPIPLTQKILDRPRLLERIRAAIPEPLLAHLTCFCATPLERTLAVRLGIPLYGTDPELYHLGTKSGSREVFREAGVPLPDGYEHLRDAQDLTAALAGLRRRHPALGRAVVKLNDGFSGESNACFSFDGAPTGTALLRWVGEQMPGRLSFEAPGENWDGYQGKLARMGGIVECFLDGAEVRSPSVQCRIDPLGGISIISTHDQVLAGPSRHVFVGCTFPADRSYAAEIQELSVPVAQVLQKRGVLGRFGIDFVSRRVGTRWEHAAIEINLRKGGTTHPYLMLQFLTDGAYDPYTGVYHTPTGQACYYYASDNLHNPAYRGLTPDDLIDIAVDRGLHFHGATQQGVVFHLIGALSEHGKLGAVCIGSDRASAMRFYHETIGVLDAEVRRSQVGPEPEPSKRNGRLWSNPLAQPQRAT